MKVVELAAKLSGGEFGDARLNRRATVMAEALAHVPNMSIPAAFNNDSVKPDRIIASHVEATYQRIDSLDFVLCVQDTTEIDLTRPTQKVDGAGPMDCESRRGAFFQPMIAFDGAGVLLGFVGQKSWTQEAISRATRIRVDRGRQRSRGGILRFAATLANNL